MTYFSITKFHYNKLISEVRKISLYWYSTVYTHIHKGFPYCCCGVAPPWLTHSIISVKQTSKLRLCPVSKCCCTQTPSCSLLQRVTSAHFPNQHCGTLGSLKQVTTQLLHLILTDMHELFAHKTQLYSMCHSTHRLCCVVL